MNYKLIEGSLNDLNNPQKTILLNRGISNWEKYLTLDNSCLYDYKLLKNIDKAVERLIYHIENNNQIQIIVDPDVDGYASASILYRYLKKMGKEELITYSLHTGKQHGLSDDINIKENIKLLIIPDAGSNDIEQCKKLHDKNVDIIILDHHLCNDENPYAIIVNNQICDYPNKNLCGVGIVYKFLQALDDELWNNYADNYLDIVALGNISDVMDIRDFETRYLVELGLNKIKSKLFKALLDKQAYSINGEINIMSIQFYITPILNAMIRVGDEDEKDLLFRAFIETNEEFSYKKRGETTETNEDIYTRATRLCINAKSRQDKAVEKSVLEIHKIIEEKQSDKNKVMFINVTSVLGETLTGLVAMKIAEQFNKPCLLLRKQQTNDDEILYGGSGRNYNNSLIDSFKDFLDNTGVFEFVSGHDNAFGFSIKKDNVINAIEIINKKLSDIDFTKYYQVDFEIDYNDLSVSFIKTICDLKPIYGTGVNEPYICIKNVPVYIENVSVIGKNKDTWKITDDNGFVFIKFKATNDLIINSFNKIWNEIEFDSDEVVEGYIYNINVIGKMSINNYNGILTPQIIVEDYERIGG